MYIIYILRGYIYKTWPSTIVPFSRSCSCLGQWSKSQDLVLKARTWWRYMVWGWFPGWFYQIRTRFASTLVWQCHPISDTFVLKVHMILFRMPQRRFETGPGNQPGKNYRIRQVATPESNLCAWGLRENNTSNLNAFRSWQMTSPCEVSKTSELFEVVWVDSRQLRTGII